MSKSSEIVAALSAKEAAAKENASAAGTSASASENKTNAVVDDDNADNESELDGCAPPSRAASTSGFATAHTSTSTTTRQSHDSTPSVEETTDAEHASLRASQA